MVLGFSIAAFGAAFPRRIRVFSGGLRKRYLFGLKSIPGVMMRTFSKSSKLDNVLYDVRGPVVDEAARMEENGMNILKLNIGNPAPFGFSPTKKSAPRSRERIPRSCSNPRRRRASARNFWITK